MKICFKCHRELPIDSFYRHPKMADGYLGKCKDCTKADVNSNREMRIDYYREYDRNRGNRQTKEYRLEYSRRPISKQIHIEYRLKFPNAYRANNMVSNAIRDKKLFREPCEICGYEHSHAHHDDYLKPLNVRWLCPAHHSQWHKEHGTVLNKL